MANCYNCGKIVLNDKSDKLCLDCVPYEEEIFKRRKTPMTSIWQLWRLEKSRMADGANQEIK